MYSQAGKWRDILIQTFGTRFWTVWKALPKFSSSQISSKKRAKNISFFSKIFIKNIHIFEFINISWPWKRKNQRWEKFSIILARLSSCVQCTSSFIAFLFLFSFLYYFCVCFYFYELLSAIKKDTQKSKEWADKVAQF